MRREAERNKMEHVLLRRSRFIRGNERNKMEHVLLRSCVLTICDQVESGGACGCQIWQGWRIQKAPLRIGAGLPPCMDTLAGSPPKGAQQAGLEQYSRFFPPCQHLPRICAAFRALSAALSRLMFSHG